MSMMLSRLQSLVRISKGKCQLPYRVSANNQPGLNAEAVWRDRSGIGDNCNGQAWRADESGPYGGSGMEQGVVGRGMGTSPVFNRGLAGPIGLHMASVTNA